ncbi:MAG: thioredoxin [Myxococcales bacterium]|nr:thioredoxin [Myxococcales bacterium]
MADYIEVNEGDWESVVVKSDVPVLVDFWAPWCGPCRAIGPHIEALATEYQGRVKVAKVNTDKNQRLAASLGIRGIPAIFMFNHGQVVAQLAGLPPNPRQRLKSLVDGVLA